jgi:hypothetical protein
MWGKQGRQFLVCILELLTAVLLWCPVAGIAGDALAATNFGIVVRKTEQDRQSPVLQSPDRPQNTVPQSKFYFGSRVEPVTTAVAPQNPYAPNYTSVLRSYHKAIIGFRFALTARAYLFVGVGMAVSDGLLEQGLGQNVNITAAQIQNALSMQTEYGLCWDF